MKLLGARSRVEGNAGQPRHHAPESVFTEIDEGFSVASYELKRRNPARGQVPRDVLNVFDNSRRENRVDALQDEAAARIVAHVKGFVDQAGLDWRCNRVRESVEGVERALKIHGAAAIRVSSPGPL